jgi:hypothetical protein
MYVFSNPIGARIGELCRAPPPVAYGGGAAGHFAQVDSVIHAGMYVYIYVFMYVCMYVFMYVFMYVCIYVCMHVSMDASTLRYGCFCYAISLRIKNLTV